MDKKVDLFEWLVKYHFDTNLEPLLDIPSKIAGSVKEGEENDSSSGCLIIENGDTLVGRLKKESIILDHTLPEFAEAKNYVSFTDFLNQHKRKDGAFFYDGLHKRLARISRYGNNSPAMNAVRENQARLVPPNFIFYGQKRPLTGSEIDLYVGTKTDLAMLLPVAYSNEGCTVKAHQVKRTAYGNTNLGKVTSFSSRGLAEEFFFHYLNLGKPNQELVGVHRCYDQRKGQLVQTYENIIDLSDIALGLMPRKQAA